MDVPHDSLVHAGGLKDRFEKAGDNMAKAPLTVKILAGLLFIFGIFAFLGSAFLWGEGFILTFPKGVDYAFPIADILINAPASIIAATGLWRLKRYGYVAAQFVAGFYVYASVEIFVHVAQGSLPFSPAILFPQVLAILVASALVFYLWRIQELFSI
jgi:hypothetical protein